MPVLFDSIVHSYRQCDRNKSLSKPSHNSQFIVQKGSRKDNKGNNQCKSNPSLEDWLSSEGYEKSDGKYS